MIGLCQERHRHREWIHFLRLIDDATPEHKQLLKPGADTRSIGIRFSGAGTLNVDRSGNLILGDVRLMPPKVIQGKKSIEAKYNGTIRSA